MGSPVKLYQTEMHQRMGFFANWLPADPIELGWAGLLEGGRFRRMTSLDELGIPFEVAEGRHEEDFQYAYASEIRTSADAGVGAAALASASLSMEFSRSGAFVFHALGLRMRSLVRNAELAQQLVHAYSSGAWDRSWRLIDGLHVARSATIVVSEGSSASLDLEAQTDDNLLSISLADPRIGLKVRRMRGTIFHAIARSDLYPLYSCIYVKDPIFGSPSVKPVRGTEDTLESAFTRPPIQELVGP